MLSLAWANLKTYARRFVAVCLAVMIGTAFLAATLMVGASATASLQRSVGAAYQHADLVIGLDWSAYPGAVEDSLGAPQLEAASAVDGVSAVHGLTETVVRVRTGAGALDAIATDYAADAGLRSAVLAAGELPRGAAQIALDTSHAEKAGLAVGSTATLAVPASDGGTTDLRVRVTGLTEPSDDPTRGGWMQATVDRPLLDRLVPGPADYRQLHLLLDPGADPRTVAGGVSAALHAEGIDHPSVLTAGERTVEDVASLSGGQDQLTVVLMVFALVALLVTGLVVANTFSVIVAQRIRELALLRTLGAVRGQVRRAVLLEALLVGAVSSTLGVLLATGVMAALVAYVGTLPGSGFAVLAVPVSAVVSGLVVGTLMTLAAAWVPARQATRVAPLAALRPADPASVRNRAGRWRIAVGGLMTAAGALLLAAGAAMGNLLVAFAGGALSFPGVLLLGSLFLPPAVSAAGKLVAGGGVPAKLASLNAVRNPGRTTATAAALLIGVTLVSMMMVGAHTTKASLDASLAEEFAVDLSVDSSGRPAPLEAADVRDAEAVQGVAAAVLLWPAGTTGDGSTVYAADGAALAAVLNDPERLPGAGQVLVAQDDERTELQATGAGGTATLEKVHSNSRSVLPVVTSATAGGFAGGTEDEGASALLWVKAEPGLDGSAVQDLRAELATALAVEDYAVGGGLMERQLYTQVIDTLLLVVTGLLAVAVFIALIGVANTLSLSVLERTRESSLLRALGLTRRQLRGMLALEAVLVAGVAALLGCVLGSAYGLLGARSVLGAFGGAVGALPWAQLGGVLLVAVAAALAASVLPARRAARLAPVEGLAAE